VDSQAWPHVDMVGNVADLSMIQSGSADLVYASHVLEYFDRKEAEGVLTEWFRVLRPGGVLRLSVPDFDQLITIYSQTDQLSSILGPLFGRMASGRDADQTEFIYHRTVWNRSELVPVLDRCGFVNARDWNWRETDHSHVDDHSQAYFPHMDKERGIQVSLNLEADRPSLAGSWAANSR
jgi:predicted SAM-dependent methyltransferase